MAWAILMGSQGSSNYDMYGQLVRHNGTTGEMLGPVCVAYPKSLHFADPFLYVGAQKPWNAEEEASYLSAFRYVVSTEGATADEVVVVSSGRPYPTKGVFRHSNSLYYGSEASYASGAVISQGVTFSVDGLEFFDAGFTAISASQGLGKLCRGENGRYVYCTNDAYIYTDDFIDSVSGSVSASYGNQFTQFAGTTTGIWVAVMDHMSAPSSWVSTDNLLTPPTILSGRVFSSVWAFGTTLYGAEDGTLYSSTNGTSWTSRGTPLGLASLTLYDMAFDPITSDYLLVGKNGLAVTTSDFSTYTPLPGYNFLNHRLYAAAYVPDSTLYPAASYSGVIDGKLRLDTSDGPFAARTVYLYNYATGEKIDETVSNGTTGDWSFTAVAPGNYFVVGVAQGDDLTVPRDFDAMGVIEVT